MKVIMIQTGLKQKMILGWNSMIPELVNGNSKILNQSVLEKTQLVPNPGNLQDGLITAEAMENQDICYFMNAERRSL